jgi:hypothetical protein
MTEVTRQQQPQQYPTHNDSQRLPHLKIRAGIHTSSKMPSYASNNDTEGVNFVAEHNEDEDDAV